MGIVLAANKGGQICIGSDSLYVVGGSRKQSSDQVTNSEKIIRWGTSFLGFSGHPIWPQILGNYCERQKGAPKLKNSEEIFAFLLELHGTLQTKYHFIPPSGEEGPFESSGFESLIVNSSGIYKTYELRSVQKFVQFAAIGSGSTYALGAMHALYDQLESAEEIVKAALESAAKFDDSTGLTGVFYQVKAK